MARPDLVAERVEEQEDESTIVVVSAPGVDAEHPVKLTDMLIAYGTNPSASNEESVIERMESLNMDTGFAGQWQRTMRQDLSGFRDRNWPVAALGEKWSAQLFSRISGRAYLDPMDNVRFSADGSLDVVASTSALNSHVSSKEKYVMPGFFGSLPDGRPHTFERGGSDISGALSARALDAEIYQNWSDVAGFLSADPRKVGAAATFLHQITYREAREFGKKGSELLHRTVPAMLGETATTTVMCNTFTGRHGTEIARTRDWHDCPILGVTTNPNLTALSLREYGMNEVPGQTTRLFDTLAHNKIPYQDSATGIDDVMVTIGHEDFGAVSDRQLFRRLNASAISSLHIIGEGLSDPSLRMKSYADIANVLYDSGVGSHGMTDAGESPGMTYFIAPDQIDTALKAAHEVIASQLAGK